MNGLQLAMFDYSALDTDTRSSMQQRAERIRQRNQVIAHNIWENGQDFYEAQQELAQHGYGCFVVWAETETGHSKSTVYNFISVYKRFDLPTVGQSNIAPRALYMLASSTTPDEAIQEAIERAHNGERITHSLAKEIVSQRKEPELVPATEWQAPPRYEELKDKLVMDSREVFICPVCNDIFDDQVWHCQFCDHHWPMSRDTCNNCYRDREETTAQKDLSSHKMTVHYSSDTPEHYTPKEILDAVIECMGVIDLDPCSNSKTESNVPADFHYTQEDDGLSHTWMGRIYMNPPYGREIGKWVEKLCVEYEAGNVTEAIALVPARTDTDWFDQLIDGYKFHCFVHGRLVFIGNDNSAPFPSAIVYFGTEWGRFYSAFRPFGRVVQETNPEMFGA